jgi:hypothetical protein
MKERYQVCRYQLDLFRDHRKWLAEGQEISAKYTKDADGESLRLRN